MFKDLQAANLPEDVLLTRHGSYFKDITQIVVKDYILSRYTGEFKSPRKITVTTQQEFLGLFLNLEKNFRYSVDDESSGLFKHQQFNLLYVPPNVRCRYVLPRGTFTAITLQCSLPILQQVKKFSQLSKFLDSVRRKVPAHLSLRKHFTARPEITDLLDEIYDDKTEPVTLRRWLQSIKMEQVVLLALDQVKNGFDPDTRPRCDVNRITDACQYLIDHLHEPFSMIHLEAVTGLSEYKLQQGFKEIYQLTVFDKLTIERLQKACDELHHTHHTVKQIAENVGYTRRAFIRVFKRKMGLTPKEFRKENKNNEIT